MSSGDKVEQRGMPVDVPHPGVPELEEGGKFELHNTSIPFEG